MTLDEFYELTAQKLGLAGVGETLNADDAAVLASRYVLVHDQLQVLGLTTWDVTEDVPDFAILPVSQMLAASTADEFAIPEPRRTRLRAEGLLHLSPVSIAERALRQLVAHPYVVTPNTAEYF